MADDDQTTDTTDDTQDDAQGADQQTTDDQNTDQLGDAGKQAIDRMKAERNAARAALKEYKTLGLSVDEIKALAAKKTADAQDDAERIREDARREARAEAQAKANERVVRSEVKAAAAGKLADPADAYRFLDLSQFEVDDDGNVNEADIAEAIDDLISKKPYLAAAQNPPRRFQGTADGGARKDKPQTLQDQIDVAEKAGDMRTVMRLKSQMAVATSQ